MFRLALMRILNLTPWLHRAKCSLTRQFLVCFELAGSYTTNRHWCRVRNDGDIQASGFKRLTSCIC